MTPDQIQKLLSLGEGQRVEIKSGIRNVEALGRVICGLLSTSGGYLMRKRLTAKARRREADLSEISHPNSLIRGHSPSASRLPACPVNNDSAGLIAMGMKDRVHFREEILRPALQAKLVEMTLPDKPRSSKQRYRLTALGRSLLPKAQPPSSRP